MVATDESTVDVDVGVDVGVDASPTEAEQAAVDRARFVGDLMDEAVRIPVVDYRIGLDPILGILPVSGDAVASIASLYIVFEGIRVGVPRRTVATMLALVGLDFLVGSIPLIGPLFDAVIKVNKRNAATIASHVEGASG